MTVEETRKLLGKEVEGLTDKEVQDMINDAKILCEILLDIFIHNHKNNLQKL